jgi:hypothetical protein
MRINNEELVMEILLNLFQIFVACIIMAFLYVCLHGAWLLIQDRQREWEERVKAKKEAQSKDN